MARLPRWQDPEGLDTINTIVKKLIPKWTNGLQKGNFLEILEDNWESDPENPRNWPTYQKWVAISIVAFYTLLPPLASSMMASGLPESGRSPSVPHSVTDHCRPDSERLPHIVRFWAALPGPVIRDVWTNLDPSHRQYFQLSFQLGMCVLFNDRLINRLSISIWIFGKCSTRHWRRFSERPLRRKRSCSSNGTLYHGTSPRCAASSNAALYSPLYSEAN